MVWIEIIGVSGKKRAKVSPPVRWCGLKFIRFLRLGKWRLSPPVRWCGLKLHLLALLYQEEPVTTRAVVWIEIVVGKLVTGTANSHHPCGGVD